MVLAAMPAAAYCRTQTCRANKTCKPDGLGCEVGGVPIQWRNRCTSYSAHVEASPELGLDVPEVERLLAQAYSTWQSAACSEGAGPSIEVHPMPTVECAVPQYNVCDRNSNAWIFPTRWLHDDALTTLGLTQVFFSTRTGEIYDADVELNVVRILALGVNVSDVITHEAGHVLGLDHSPEYEATMYAEYTGRPLSILGADDAAAICAVYPPARTALPCDVTPRNGFARHCGTEQCESTVSALCSAVPGRPGSWIALYFAALGVAACVLRRRQTVTIQRRVAVP